MSDPKRSGVLLMKGEKKEKYDIRKVGAGSLDKLEEILLPRKNGASTHRKRGVTIHTWPRKKGLGGK